MWTFKSDWRGTCLQQCCKQSCLRTGERKWNKELGRRARDKGDRYKTLHSNRINTHNICWRGVTIGLNLPHLAQKHLKGGTSTWQNAVLQKFALWLGGPGSWQCVVTEILRLSRTIRQVCVTRYMGSKWIKCDRQFSYNQHTTWDCPGEGGLLSASLTEGFPDFPQLSGQCQGVIKRWGKALTPPSVCPKDPRFTYTEVE